MSVLKTSEKVSSFPLSTMKSMAELDKILQRHFLLNSHVAFHALLTGT